MHFESFRKRPKQLITLTVTLTVSSGKQLKTSVSAACPKALSSHIALIRGPETTFRSGDGCSLGDGSVYVFNLMDLQSNHIGQWRTR